MSHQELKIRLGISIREGFKYKKVSFKIIGTAGGIKGRSWCDPKSRNYRKSLLPCQGSSEPTMQCFHRAMQPLPIC